MVVIALASHLRGPGLGHESVKLVVGSLQKFGFIKRVDKGWITTVKDLES